MGARADNAKKNIDLAIERDYQAGIANVPGADQIKADLTAVPGSKGNEFQLQGTDATHAAQSDMAALGKNFLQMQATGGALPGAERTILMNKLGAMAGGPATAGAAAGVAAQGQNAQTAQNVSNFAAQNLSALDNSQFMSKLNEFSLMGTARHASAAVQNQAQQLTNSLNQAQAEGENTLASNQNAARTGGQMQQLQAAANDRQAFDQMGATIAGAVGQGASAGLSAYNSMGPGEVDHSADYVGKGNLDWKSSSPMSSTAPNMATAGSGDFFNPYGQPQSSAYGGSGFQDNGNGISYTPTDVFT